MLFYRSQNPEGSSSLFLYCRTRFQLFIIIFFTILSEQVRNRRIIIVIVSVCLFSYF